MEYRNKHWAKTGSETISISFSKETDGVPPLNISLEIFHEIS